MDEFVKKEIKRIQTLVGNRGQVIGLSLRLSQELHFAETRQVLYLEELTLRCVSHNGRESQELTETGCSQAHE